jgi:hypothetical protein
MGRRNPEMLGKVVKIRKYISEEGSLRQILNISYWKG